MLAWLRRVFSVLLGLSKRSASASKASGPKVSEVAFWRGEVPAPNSPADSHDTTPSLASSAEFDLVAGGNQRSAISAKDKSQNATSLPSRISAETAPAATPINLATALSGVGVHADSSPNLDSAESELGQVPIQLASVADCANGKQPHPNSTRCEAKPESASAPTEVVEGARLKTKDFASPTNTAEHAQEQEQPVDKQAQSAAEPERAPTLMGADEQAAPPRSMLGTQDAPITRVDQRVGPGLVKQGAKIDDVVIAESNDHFQPLNSQPASEPQAASGESGIKESQTGIAQNEARSPSSGRPAPTNGHQRVESECTAGFSPSASAKPAETDDALTGELCRPRAPSRYRPQLRERSGGVAAPAPTSPRSGSGLGVLDADLMVMFDPGGSDIEVSLLLRRADGMPDEVAVRTGEGRHQLVAIDETYYEPLGIADLVGALHGGIAAESAGVRGRRWVRSGRPLHVFSNRPGIAGFASVPRAVIGQENIILCTEHMEAAVMLACEATGADTLRRVDGASVADGWRCFRGYMPRHPAPSEGVDDILLALYPLPDATIELSGGLSVERGVWIADRPPAIRIVGVAPSNSEVVIDGHAASASAAGWTAPGWNLPGQHLVRYRGLSRSYEIVSVEEHWDAWPAHIAQGYSVCGALVSGPADATSLVVPLPGCWLVGATAGQVCWAPPAIQGHAVAAPSFTPVWAIPARTGRTRPMPRLLDPSAAPPQPAPRGAAQSLRQRRWRELLRDSAPALANPRSDQLWQRYREAARARMGRRR